MYYLTNQITISFSLVLRLTSKEKPLFQIKNKIKILPNFNPFVIYLKRISFNSNLHYLTQMLSNRQIKKKFLCLNLNYTRLCRFYCLQCPTRVLPIFAKSWNYLLIIILIFRFVAKVITTRGDISILP